MAAKKKKSTTDKPRVTKTSFIQGFGPDVSADEIVAKGKAAGLSFTKKYVWTKQSEMRTGKVKPTKPANGTAAKAAPSTTGAIKISKAKPTKKAKPGRKPGASAAAAARPTPRAMGGDAEHRMRALIIELGTERAAQVYRDVQTKLSAFVAQA